MGTLLQYFMIFVQVVVGFMLIGIILLQKSKNQGMGTAFGGGMGESLFGSQVGNVLTKVTVVLAFIFLLNSTMLAFVKTSRHDADESVTDRADDVAPTLPAQTAQQPQDEAAEPVWDRAVDTNPPVDMPPADDIAVDVPLVDLPALDASETAPAEPSPSEPAPDNPQTSE